MIVWYLNVVDIELFKQNVIKFTFLANVAGSVSSRKHIFDDWPST